MPEEILTQCLKKTRLNGRSQVTSSQDFSLMRQDSYKIQFHTMDVLLHGNLILFSRILTMAWYAKLTGMQT